MHIIALGVSHRTAGVELREKLVMNDDRATQVTQRLRSEFHACEVVVLSTCNRTELYVARPALEPPSTGQVLDLLCDFTGTDAAVLQDKAVGLENERAVTHLFRVACGLESMVLGEAQVLGQVKRAYDAAIARGAVGSVLHRIFQHAIGTAKKARRSTGIGLGRVSVGSVAIDFAKQIFERFDDKVVLGIGAGEMAKPMLGYLRALEPAKLWLTNRSLDKAQALAAKLGLSESTGGARPFEALDGLLLQADIVITSTSAASPIITARRCSEVFRQRRGRPLFLVDIAVPRDVEPAVGRLSNVYLYNIDDLQRVVEGTYDQRSRQVCACEAMVTEAVRGCLAQVQHCDIGRLVRNLRRRLHDLGRIEGQRTQRRLTSSHPDELARVLPEAIEEHTQRLINKILHLPLTQLDHRRSDASLAFYAAALRGLFGLDDELSQADDQGQPPPDSEQPTPSAQQPHTLPVARAQQNQAAPGRANRLVG